MYLSVKAWDSGRLVDVLLVQPRDKRGRFVQVNDSVYGITQEKKAVHLKQDEQGKLYVEDFA